ncbi:carbamoyltransferase HypF [Hydrogenophaga aromaticivorans]|uniref:Kae1-like domain-containing protein n=1 Tax=Hydrogenophaga aromaticivorans TaxID=2610898 RepID=UPI001B36A33C|nr:carbamoyltransferase HypF [Hydrogenophaga aromaticivorans]MBQ0922144.1 carbamoyltransferase HypF [Hydrogenophaga aromaticivorans]
MNTAPLPTVLACGAWLKNAACLLVDGAPVWSAVHGDLSDPAACAALEASVEALLAGHGAPIAAVAHDLHPDFFSTQLAVQLAAALGVPAIGVQHHHAHIAAVVAEHHIDGPVIGLALDGVGLGTDGQAWGGELLWVDGAQWLRLGHLMPLALPGGDRAAREPWRMAASALHAMGRGEQIASRFAPQVGEAVAAGVQQMLEKTLNCPATSSTGRWFDAAAGVLGLSVRQADEAQAAIALEAAAARWLALYPDTTALPGAVIDAQNRLDLRGLMPALFDTGTDGVDAAAAGFHLALADALADWAVRAAFERGSREVCLGGGCFFNGILRERVTTRLQAAALRVHRPLDKGCGDAGLALGQAWVAAQQLAATQQKISSKETEPCV